jgi:hypothetical protein
MAWNSWWNWWGKSEHEKSIANFGVWLHKNYWMEVNQLKDYWWSLPERHKRRIALEAIKAYTQVIGLVDLSRCPTQREGEFRTSYCVGNAFIRCCMLGTMLEHIPEMGKAEYKNRDGEIVRIFFQYGVDEIIPGDNWQFPLDTKAHPINHYDPNVKGDCGHIGYYGQNGDNIYLTTFET